MNGALPVAPSYKDLDVGREFRTSRVTVTETHVVGWANLTGDWHALHMDDEYARVESAFGRRIAHGPLVFGLGVGLVQRANILGDSVIAWLGVDGLRATAPVFFGDTVGLVVTVAEQRLSGKDPSRGVVSFDFDTRNQEGVSVMRCRYSVLMRT